VTDVTRAVTGRRADAPAWLRWGSLGCGAVALLLLAALFGGALSTDRLRALGRHGVAAAGCEWSAE
jgi:hypothetical protein